ncbi:MAG: hypothetical protein LBI72_00380 [Flavobacteriaceae bacterium]|jgi:predicted acetyltransferase|nr:hypothetical protein [Flavobacteriaceae bacterium]
MLQIDRVKIEEKQTLRNLMQLYKYDFSEYDPEDVDLFGLYDYPYLDYYFVEPDRFAYLIRIEGVLAGFVLVRYTGEVKENIAVVEMVEYFILKKFRRNRIGSKVAKIIFNKHEGYWKVAVLESNIDAFCFWKKVITELKGNDFQEKTEDEWNGKVFMFKNE